MSIFLFEFSKKTSFSRKKKSSLRFYCDPSLIVIQKNMLTKTISPGQYKSYVSTLEGTLFIHMPSFVSLFWSIFNTKTCTFMF